MKNIIKEVDYEYVPVGEPMTEEEKLAWKKGKKQIENGECISLDDFEKGKRI